MLCAPQTAKLEECRGLVRYKTLRNEILSKSLQALELRRNETKAFVEDMIFMETQYFSKNYFRDLFRPGGIEDEDGQMKKIRTLDGGLVTDPVEGVSGEEQYLKQVRVGCCTVLLKPFY